MTDKEKSINQSHNCLHFPSPPSLSLKVPEPLWTPPPFAWRTEAMEWLQVMQASSPGPSHASPTGCSWPCQRYRQSGRENKAIPQIKATTLVIPTFHLRHFGNVCAHQGEIWCWSEIKGPAPLSHKEVAAKEWNASPLFSFTAPATAPAPAVPSSQGQPASS